MKQISLHELKSTIKNLYKLCENGDYISAMIWGPMGIGKSQVVFQVAEELGIEFIDLRLSQMNPVDLRGLPTVDKVNNKAVWISPDFLPNGNHGEKGILFLDEINLAPQSVMSAGYQLVLDRKLGDYEMPKKWLILAAGNRSEDTPNTTKMPPPLANRFIHFEITSPNFEEWRDWAVKNGVDEKIVAFLSKMPHHLFKVPAITDKAFPTPRSWSFASHLMKIGEEVDSAVGGGTATEFRAFTKVYARIPDIEKILEGDEKVEVPKATELDVLWATSMALVYRAKPEHWKNVYAYIKRLPKEFMVLIIKLLDDKSPHFRSKIIYSKEWKEFTKENPAVFGE